MLFFLPLPIKRKTLYNGRIPIDSIVISRYNYNAVIVNVVSGFFPNFVSAWCASVSFQFYFKPQSVLKVFLKSVNKLFPLCLWELVSKDGAKLSYGTSSTAEIVCVSLGVCLTAWRFLCYYLLRLWVRNLQSCKRWGIFAWARCYFSFPCQSKEKPFTMGESQ